MKLLLDENLAAATRVASIEAINTTHRRALDALFASLQQRAFAGQL